MTNFLFVEPNSQDLMLVVGLQELSCRNELFDGTSE